MRRLFKFIRKLRGRETAMDLMEDYMKALGIKR